MSGDKQKKGDIAKLLRVIRNIDNSLAVTGDATCFVDSVPGEVVAISNSLMQARMATKNLLRKHGYPADSIGFPPHQFYRGT